MKVLVQCADYNGYKNVLFMMKDTDFRLADEKFGYKILGQGKYVHKTRTLIVNDQTYKVFSDWSVKQMQVQQ